MKNQREGLPHHLFAYVSSITPLVNIDVIILDINNHYLLTWRDDGTYGPGWHIPGGIIRFKESVISRIRKVCLSEANIELTQAPSLVQINQIMNPTREYRGHFISLLFQVKLSRQFTDPSFNDTISTISNGDRFVFDKCPENLIPQHDRYRDILQSIGTGLSPVSQYGNILEDYSEYTDFI